MNVPEYVRVKDDGVVLAIKVQARASVNAIAGPLGKELRIKLTAPPVDSAANDVLISFLSQILNCPRNRILLLHGRTSRHKSVKVLGLHLDDIIVKLDKDSADF